jgi:hypothetical protein
MTVFLRSLGSVSSLLVATVYQGNHDCFILNVLTRNGISVSEHESNLCWVFFLYHLLIYVLPWDVSSGTATLVEDMSLSPPFVAFVLLNP